MSDHRMIDALNMATSLELFKLNAVIDRLLNDPKRIIAIRVQLHIGQTVQFFDWQRQQMRPGRVVALRDRQVVVHDEGARVEWKLPYAAIEPPKGAPGGSDGPTPSEKSAPPRPQRGDFRVGEKVTFDDRYLQTHVGTIVRINQRTASIDSEGSSWRVPFSGLRHLVDV